jgi:dihydrofolate reductase
MAKTLWHTTMSLDGFVAGPGDDLSWMAGHAGPVLLPAIGAVLMGGRTYRYPGEGEAYGNAWSGPQFVLTRTPPAPAREGFVFVDDVGTAVAQASAAAGDRYVAVLGPTAARSCLEAGLLDEILVHVAPVLLGDGVRLFGGERVGLEPIRTGADGLWFRV